MSEILIGVDLGGTRIRAAQFDSDLSILNRTETLTRADEGLEPTIERIKAQIRNNLPQNSNTLHGIGISAPGPLNPATGVVVHPPNLHGWQDVPLVQILQDEFGIPVYLGNDANVAALAEVALGAGRGYRHAIYLTWSTGVGSGIVVDGNLLLGREGLAAEAGHMVMLVEGRVSSLELETAGPDMAAQAAQRLTSGEESVIRTMINSSSEISGAIVGKAAQQGDALALSVINRSSKIFGLGIVNLLHLFNPQIIIVGGGVSNLGDLIFKPMRDAVEQYAIDSAYWRELVITTPELGEDVSIYGAGVLAATQGGVRNVVQVAEEIKQRTT